MVHFILEVSEIGPRPATLFLPKVRPEQAAPYARLTPPPRARLGGLFEAPWPVVRRGRARGGGGRCARHGRLPRYIGPPALEGSAAQSARLPGSLPPPRPPALLWGLQQFVVYGLDFQSDPA